MPSSEGDESGTLPDKARFASISVIIPAYNCASFLPETLESVFSQTHPVLEVIVVDDGSTDETSSVVQAYLGRIRYIRQENKGLPGARNTGIVAAKGDYLALLDADDTWVSTKLAQQMPRFADPEVGIVYSDFAVRYSDGRYQESYLVNRPLAAEGAILDRYIQSRFLFPSTMVFRKECFEQIGLFDEEMLACEDIELFARMCAHWKVALVNQSLMIRFEGSHNITADSRKMGEYTILALGKLLEKERTLSRATRTVVHREVGRQHSWAGYTALEQGEVSRARGHLMRAIRYDLRNLRPSVRLLAASLLPASLRRSLRGLKGARKTG